MTIQGKLLPGAGCFKKYMILKSDLALKMEE
jgi:hypothetical protein